MLSLRQLVDKRLKMQADITLPVVVVFEKAFDTIPRKTVGLIANFTWVGVPEAEIRTQTEE